MFWHLRKRGVLVMIFTVNSEDELIRARKYPIDGFITDAPTEIIRALYSNGGQIETDIPMIRSTGLRE